MLADTPLHEYSLRVVVRVQRRGAVTPERRHLIVESLTHKIEKRRTGKQRAKCARYVVDMCEVREIKRV